MIFSSDRLDPITNITWHAITKSWVAKQAIFSYGMLGWPLNIAFQHTLQPLDPFPQ